MLSALKYSASSTLEAISQEALSSLLNSSQAIIEVAVLPYTSEYLSPARLEPTGKFFSTEKNRRFTIPCLSQFLSFPNRLSKNCSEYSVSSSHTHSVFRIACSITFVAGQVRTSRVDAVAIHIAPLIALALSCFHINGKSTVANP